MSLIIVTRCNGCKNASNWHGKYLKWNNVPNIWGPKVKQNKQNTEILCTSFYAKEVCVTFTFLLTVFWNLQITIHKHAPKVMIPHSSAYIKCQKFYPLCNLSYLLNHNDSLFLYRPLKIPCKSQLFLPPTSLSHHPLVPVSLNMTL